MRNPTHSTPAPTLRPSQSWALPWGCRLRCHARRRCRPTPADAGPGAVAAGTTPPPGGMDGRHCFRFMPAEGSGPCYDENWYSTWMLKGCRWRAQPCRGTGAAPQTRGFETLHSAPSREAGGAGPTFPPPRRRWATAQRAQGMITDISRLAPRNWNIATIATSAHTAAGRHGI